MIIDFSEYLGEVKNDTGIWGKAFIFKVIETKDNEPYTFDTVLFIHESVPAFVSTAPEDDEYDKKLIISKILKQYPMEKLMEVKHED